MAERARAVAVERARNEATIAEQAAEIERLRDGWDFVKAVHDTFERDMAQGYKTRDKTFAVDLLGKALATRAEQGE